jgi:hypothetical protein
METTRRGPAFDGSNREKTQAGGSIFRRDAQGDGKISLQFIPGKVQGKLLKAFALANFEPRVKIAKIIIFISNSHLKHQHVPYLFFLFFI